jgi:hypothetical protein
MQDHLSSVIRFPGGSRRGQKQKTKIPRRAAFATAKAQLALNKSFDHDLISLFEHDLFGKPVPTFPDYALSVFFDHL